MTRRRPSWFRIAIANRPEIASQRELLAAANQRLKQEKKRPFLPSLYILSSSTTTGLLAAGNLSAGPNGSMGANGPAANFEVAAVWQLQNAGIGNIGRIRQRRAEQDLASIEVTRVLFRVRAEVQQALARLQTARARVPQTEEGLRQAIESADKNFIGLRETTRPAGELLRLVVRPQEVVAALIALERGLRAILGGRQRVQRGTVRPLSCARPASPVGHRSRLRSGRSFLSCRDRYDRRTIGFKMIAINLPRLSLCGLIVSAKTMPGPPKPRSR